MTESFDSLATRSSPHAASVELRCRRSGEWLRFGSLGGDALRSGCLRVAARLTHGGGELCGQAILSCMDPGMVFVMMSLNDDPEASFTTVQLQTSFKRGVPARVGEVTFEAHASKTGRTLVFGEIDLYLPDGQRAAHATTTYMWL